ncbi:hypothetical protein B0H19DRAFT_1250633 [Mycena capillaripes]|nr:hypothetical protein B0H19DRAFT_1250633 [Mycena capillaripes]
MFIYALFNPVLFPVIAKSSKSTTFMIHGTSLSTTPQNSSQQGQAPIFRCNYEPKKPKGLCSSSLLLHVIPGPKNALNQPLVDQLANSAGCTATSPSSFIPDSVPCRFSSSYSRTRRRRRLRHLPPASLMPARQCRSLRLGMAKASCLCAPPASPSSLLPYPRLCRDTVLHCLRGTARLRSRPSSLGDEPQLLGAPCRRGFDTRIPSVRITFLLSPTRAATRGSIQAPLSAVFARCKRCTHFTLQQFSASPVWHNPRLAADGMVWLPLTRGAVDDAVESPGCD